MARASGDDTAPGRAGADPAPAPGSPHPAEPLGAEVVGHAPAGKPPGFRILPLGPADPRRQVDQRAVGGEEVVDLDEPERPDDPHEAVRGEDDLANAFHLTAYGVVDRVLVERCHP